MIEMQAYVAIGSNVGDSLGYIIKALQSVDETEGITLAEISPVYTSLPLGENAKGVFYNLVIRIFTSLQPDELFQSLQLIEEKTGRIRRAAWGDREIDLDILLYDNIVMDSTNITIPHKEMHKRDFVLVPLLQLAPQLIHPGTMIPFADYERELANRYINKNAATIELQLIGKKIVQKK
ncbi:MAG: 2-amino-4-hydroxy-6-hydroxymethyldihydropteridine diphosphokinase [Ignavibacteria bacterium]|nr:2-amino-4-hydroxy-6-hydroxymethyldihydropteridine diphosphokinase [Ignavibacteria bacterium]